MTTARQHLDLSSFFERLERELFVNTDTDTKYPLYNLIHYPENDSGVSYTILELAVAGFAKHELTVLLEGNRLKVLGEKDKLPANLSEGKYLQKQITSKPFRMEFAMAKNSEIKEVQLRDGILTVTVKKTIPERMKPKKLEIK